MRDYTLAHLLLTPPDFALDHPELLYRCSQGAPAWNAERGALELAGPIDFATYLNGLSIAKWRRYTCVKAPYLHIELAGDGADIYLSMIYAGDTIARRSELPIATVEPSEVAQSLDIALDVPADCLIVGVEVFPKGSCSIVCASYFSKVGDDEVRDVKLLLSTTTFKKEHYITENIRNVREALLGGPDPASDRFQMLVVDNGRTLDAEALSGDGVTVIGNDNVGGAGGFARGMIEALEREATHVLLMDDDVRILPESIFRTLNLLALRNDAYEGAFLNGAMLNIERPNVQFEDVAFVRMDGTYDRIKPNLAVDAVSDLAKNESIDVEIKRAYGAWWYSCIPTSVIRDNGLPLPLFVRCDDVEFGMRTMPTYMTMSGICVWHEQFAGRASASVDGYQYIRNFLIMNASDDLPFERAFVARFSRTFNIYLRSMNYWFCDLMLQGFEDYMKGPDFLANAVGEQIFMDNRTRNEPLVPVEELDQSVMAKIKPDLRYFGEFLERSIPRKLVEQIPHDRHLLPDRFLIHEPAAIYYCRGAYPARATAARDTLVALNMDATRGNIRRLDRARWQSLKDRYRSLMADYRSRGREIRASWKSARPYLTSLGFWKRYLKLQS